MGEILGGAGEYEANIWRREYRMSSGLPGLVRLKRDVAYNTKSERYGRNNTPFFLLSGS